MNDCFRGLMVPQVFELLEGLLDIEALASPDFDLGDVGEFEASAHLFVLGFANVDPDGLVPDDLGDLGEGFRILEQDTVLCGLVVDLECCQLVVRIQLPHVERHPLTGVSIDDVVHPELAAGGLLGVGAEDAQDPGLRHGAVEASRHRPVPEDQEDLACPVAFQAMALHAVVLLSIPITRDSAIIRPSSCRDNGIPNLRLKLFDASS